MKNTDWHIYKAYLVDYKTWLVVGMSALIDSGQTFCLPILLLVVIIIKIVLYGLSLKTCEIPGKAQFAFLILGTVLILLKYSSVFWIIKKLILEYWHWSFLSYRVVYFLFHISHHIVPCPLYSSPHFADSPEPPGSSPSSLCVHLHVGGLAGRLKFEKRW